MNKLKPFALLITMLSASLLAQPANTEVDFVNNHNNWGWTSIVQKNDLITVATVPVIGARIMQYDLGDHSFLYINSSEIGKTYSPMQGGFHGFGGYVVWPAPQAIWDWPPPPILDYGVYDANIVIDSADSTSVFVSSQKEMWQAPDLRFERKMTIYKGSSRVRVDQTIINEGKQTVSWSVWDVTQTIAKTPRENYWVYFPINPNSEHGKDGVYFRDNLDSDAWKGEVAPGIYGVEHRPDGKKLFADSHKGWIVYVDEGKGKTYAKTFKIFEGLTYPGDNGGGRVQVFLGGSNFEVEVASPIVDLDPMGGEYTFTEDWWATTVNGPIKDVNQMGAIGDLLKQDTQTGNLVGTYGVFHIGTAKLVFKDVSGVILAEGSTHDVTPLETLVIDESLALPENMATVDVVIYNTVGEKIGVLDSASYEQLTSVQTVTRMLPKKANLEPNYPNPFNSGTIINYQLSANSDVELSIYNVAGRLVETLVKGNQPAGSYSISFDGSKLSSGIYLCNLRSGNRTITQRMLLIK